MPFLQPHLGPLRPLLFQVLFIWAVLFAVTTPSPAADAPTNMLVIDGSGSMWARFEADKRAKIDVIRDALKGPVAAAGTTHIGITSFGHRRRSDCSDVEVIAEPTETRDGVLYALEKLNPRGKGPLVAGLRAATAALGASRPASLIVINDGPDNCQQDACAFATEFAKSTPGVPIHVISVGVEPADQPRLQCIATATGGTYRDAVDATELVAAIEAATKLAMLAPKPADAASPEVATAAAVPAGASIRVTAALAEGGAALTMPMHWRIFKSGASQSFGESEGPDFSARLEPGNYEVEVEAGGIRQRKPVTIEAGKQVSMVIALNAGRLKVVMTPPKNGDAAQPALIAISTSTSPASGEAAEGTQPAAGKPAWLAYSRQTEAILPPGAYKVALTLGQIRQEKAIDLAPGTDAAVTFDIGSAQLQVSAAASEGGPPLSDVTFAISEDDPDSPTGKRDVARSRASVASFTLPAGTYYITARSGDAEVRQRIGVGAGDAVKQTLILPLIPVSVSTNIAGQPAAAASGIVYRVYALEGDTARPILRSLQPALALNLMPGRYRFAAHLDANHLNAVQDVTLEPGKRADVVVKLDAAEVSLKAPASAAVSDRFWEIVDMKGKTVWHTAVAEPKALLSPGRYIVKLESRDTSLEAAFEVHSGDRQTLQLGNN